MARPHHTELSSIISLVNQLVLACINDHRLLITITMNMYWEGIHAKLATRLPCILPHEISITCRRSIG